MFVTVMAATDLYLGVIWVLVAKLLKPLPNVLAQSLVLEVEQVEVGGHFVGAGHRVLATADAAIETRMVILEFALEFLQTEIVNLLIFGC